jgi:hypothetical protein
MDLILCLGSYAFRTHDDGILDYRRFRANHGAAFDDRRPFVVSQVFATSSTTGAFTHR